MAERVKRVIELMQGNPSRSFTLGKMAESVNLSPPYFCYLFKTITGVPPAKYLKSLRLQEAATLLTTTFLSVKEIVRRVGLTDESHFVRDFKRLYGVTPSEYRNNAKGFDSADGTPWTAVNDDCNSNIQPQITPHAKNLKNGQ